MAIDWILIADRARAEILRVFPSEHTKSPFVDCFVHKQGRLRPKVRNSNEASRVMTPHGSVSAHKPHEDREHAESRRFAAQLVAYLESSRLDRRFDQLTVLAPPKFLGVLRDAWTPSLQKMIRAEIPQDLMQLPESELEKRPDQFVSASAV